MTYPRLTSAVPATLAAAAMGVLAGGGGAAEAKEPWLGEEMPLPLAVRTPADLALKAVAERQYLVFNLLAGGKVAWDKGDYAAATQKWEALLRLPDLDPEVDRVVRPLAAEARGRSGGKAPALPPPPPPAATSSVTPRPSLVSGANRVTVTGTINGGGRVGPGGAVVWLKRAAGPTPRAAPGRTKVITQINKTFVPRVLPVTVGSKVDFKNEDALFHNVFSLSRPNDFDAGLYKGGQSYSRTFNEPGAVQILCNIHASMLAYVVVVDTPWYAQAGGSGQFSIRGVPPGEYVLEAWHESSSGNAQTKIAVGRDGLRGVEVQLAGNRRAPAFVPDKYGKPRQAQLGY